MREKQKSCFTLGAMRGFRMCRPSPTPARHRRFPPREITSGTRGKVSFGGVKKNPRLQPQENWTCYLGILDEFRDDNRVITGYRQGVSKIGNQVVIWMGNIHGRTAEHIGWTNNTGIPYCCTKLLGFLQDDVKLSKVLVYIIRAKFQVYLVKSSQYRTALTTSQNHIGYGFCHT